MPGCPLFVAASKIEHLGRMHPLARATAADASICNRRNGSINIRNRAITVYIKKQRRLCTIKRIQLKAVKIIAIART